VEIHICEGSNLETDAVKKDHESAHPGNVLPAYFRIPSQSIERKLELVEHRYDWCYLFCLFLASVPVTGNKLCLARRS
jgi:hypothetical protein